IPQARVDNLVRVYGDAALTVLDVAEREGLAGPLNGEGLPIAAEALHCAEAEMVVHLDDFLARRTRLALTDPAAGTGAASVAPELLGAALGWGEAARTAEVERHRSLVERERGIPLHEEHQPPAAHAGAG
ncbi:MAG: hypothetical protein M3134_08775, partial [Actinomycetota bacterium]|nr:hypothetical protein [Actinomycetota bacterium]